MRTLGSAKDSGMIRNLRVVRPITLCMEFREWRRLRRRGLAAQQRDQSEICGLICLSPKNSLLLRYLRNEAGGAASWQLSDSSIRTASAKVRRMGLRVIGLFHSHPISEAIPGPRDRHSITLRDWQLIYDVCGHDAKLWRRDRNGRVKEVAFVIERAPPMSLQNGRARLENY
jgi:proteasome lid subunit RPN8/RPN11